ncbi:hypothetical protein [Ichthyenterobacterium magnum]|uniref:Uncharacterized protein n=1 Tax=Ichthyenterobacterium magnum TaxID=1230530 RepID=A0A420DXA8_9FLAO|nr:hypothetical protein [Ichthyenterobacterium magnum]RKE98882.1 hypothetical protein BXY80_0977 [Ichthyenterobacterium magnum]
MKKFLVLFVMAFFLFSFSSTGENNNIESKQNMLFQLQSCCTASVTYNGRVVKTFTNCISGIGPAAVSLACSISTNEAEDYIANAQAAIEALNNALKEF